MVVDGGVEMAARGKRYEGQRDEEEDPQTPKGRAPQTLHRDTSVRVSKGNSGGAPIDTSPPRRAALPAKPRISVCYRSLGALSNGSFSKCRCDLRIVYMQTITLPPRRAPGNSISACVVWLAFAY